jgi:GntR family transcriptional regulator
MPIRVDSGSPVPIYEQIADQLVFAVAGGDLAAGDLVPSVRELSVQLTVNPNTVVRAYQQLELLGVLEPLRGRGMAVTADAVKRCRARRKELLRGRVDELVREAVSAGLNAEDLHQLIDAGWPTASRNGKKPV